MCISLEVWRAMVYKFPITLPKSGKTMFKLDFFLDGKSLN